MKKDIKDYIYATLRDYVTQSSKIKYLIKIIYSSI